MKENPAAASCGVSPTQNGSRIQITNDPMVCVCFLAINHFISTDDVIGSGLILHDEKRVEIVVSKNTQNPIDLMDAARFEARLAFIAPEAKQLGVPISYVPFTFRHPFEISLVCFPEGKRERLIFSALLMEDSKPHGWGSTKPLVDAMLGQTGHTRLLEAARLYLNVERAARKMGVTL